MSSFVVAKKVFDLSASANLKVLVGVSRSEFSGSADPKVKVLKKHFDYTVTVQFDAAGGTSPKDSDTFVVGEKYKLPTPTRYSYRFDGWFTAASGGTQITDDDLVSFQVTKLYAHWTAVDFSNGTEFDVVTTSSYKKTGIYSATRYSGLSSVFVDWGDGTMDEVDGNISQLAHEYSSVGTFRVRITDNISNFAASYGNSTWYNTTSQNRYTFKNMVKTGSRCTSMPTYAFYYCSALSSIDFLSSCWTGLTSLPGYAFYYCSGVTQLSSLPSRIKTLGSSCFRYCTGLTGIQDLRNTGLTSLYNAYTFANCSNVKEWKLPTSLSGTYFGTYQFYYDNTLSAIQLPSQLTSIASNCFEYCRQLKSITIPSQVKGIGNYAFRYCYQLSSVAYETTALTSIGTNAFYYNYSLRNINIPDTVKSVGNYAFYNCYSSYASALTLPSALTSVGTYAYQSCYSLKTLSIPSGLTSIGNYAFAGCRALSSITDYRLTAQTVSQYTFGQLTGTGTTAYTGYNTRGSNDLSIYWDATGYDTGYWLDPLQNQDKCGFNIKYLDPEHVRWCDVTFDARCCGEIDGSRTAQQRYGQGKTIGVLPTPAATTEDIQFEGWYTGIDGTGTKYEVGMACPTQDSITLYAHWQVQTGAGGTISYDLNNGAWRQSETQTNPDPDSFYGVFESTNTGQDGTAVEMRVVASNVDELTIYIRSCAEGECDYTVALQPNIALDDVYQQGANWTAVDVSNPNVAASTSDGSSSGQDLASYIPVTYRLGGSGVNYISIAYGKDSSVSTHDDRGYVLIPKNSTSWQTYDTREMLDIGSGNALAVEGKDAAIKLEQYT